MLHIVLSHQLQLNKIQIQINDNNKSFQKLKQKCSVVAKYYKDNYGVRFTIL